MNGKRREKEDARIQASSPIIRTHRRNEPVRKTASAALALMAISMVFTTANSDSHTDATVVHPAVASAPSTAAPENASNEGAPGDHSWANPPDSNAPESPPQRANRSAERKPPPPPPSKVERVIAFALSQQGKPYRWANSGPVGYDCSGLVMRSFAQIGIKLPHFTGTMLRYGTRINRASMQRGDIVFPSGSHVGIYLGNNTMVHASSSKGRVVVGKVYSFYTARRI